MASDSLLAELEAIARAERVPLAQVIREGMELRARSRASRLHLLASVSSEGSPGPTARQSSEVRFEPGKWR